MKRVKLLGLKAHSKTKVLRLTRPMDLYALALFLFALFIYSQALMANPINQQTSHQTNPSPKAVSRGRGPASVVELAAPKNEEFGFEQRREVKVLHERYESYQQISQEVGEILRPQGIFQRINED